jgi:hypothetical protein
MSTLDIKLAITRTRTAGGATDPYDHAISLVDTTVSTEPENEPPPTSQSSGWKRLVPKSTKSLVREQLVRRTYSKYQQDKDPSKEGNTRTDEGESPDTLTPPHDILRPLHDSPTQEASETDVADFAEQNPPNRYRNGNHGKCHKRRSEQPYELDILYENQRGWFFFGIPLYSHSSLLNFDPAPWVTKDLKDSAVNITNAQVPDPSWMWSWKAWYVDMSHDVDEQGWQYSFSFGRSFSWHGTHPWFHSFVRRRRWLRKRVKRQDFAGYEKATSLGVAHNLTGDYFTIHPKQGKSPGSPTDDAIKSARTSSYMSIRACTETDEPPEDIQNIPSLLRALRFAKIDREKIDIVKKFVDQGGDELAYLGEKIPEIMSFMIFQNSRRQLLLFLKQTAQDAQKHREEHDAEEKPEGAAEGRRIDNLLAAVKAADGEIRGLEYWSDRKHILKTVDDTNGRIYMANCSGNDRSGLDNNPVITINGIPENAEIKDQTSQLMKLQLDEEQEPMQDKDKGKAVDRSDGQQEHENVEKGAITWPQDDSVVIPKRNNVNGGH